MTPKQFVELAKTERDVFLKMCFDRKSKSEVAARIAALKLDSERNEALKKALDVLLTDVFYTFLLALDGCANLGGEQHDYVLTDEDGNLLTDCGEIEAHAYDILHGGPSEED